MFSIIKMVLTPRLDSLPDTVVVIYTCLAAFPDLVVFLATSTSPLSPSSTSDLVFIDPSVSIPLFTVVIFTILAFFHVFARSTSTRGSMWARVIFWIVTLVFVFGIWRWFPSDPLSVLKCLFDTSNWDTAREIASYYFDPLATMLEHVACDRDILDGEWNQGPVTSLLRLSLQITRLGDSYVLGQFLQHGQAFTALRVGIWSSIVRVSPTARHPDTITLFLSRAVQFGQDTCKLPVPADLLLTELKHTLLSSLSAHTTSLDLWFTFKALTQFAIGLHASILSRVVYRRISQKRPVSITRCLEFWPSLLIVVLLCILEYMLNQPTNQKGVTTDRTNANPRAWSPILAWTSYEPVFGGDCLSLSRIGGYVYGLFVAVLAVVQNEVDLSNSIARLFAITPEESEQVLGPVAHIPNWIKDEFLAIGFFYLAYKLLHSTLLLVKSSIFRTEPHNGIPFDLYPDHPHRRRRHGFPLLLLTLLALYGTSRITPPIRSILSTESLSLAIWLRSWKSVCPPTWEYMFYQAGHLTSIDFWGWLRESAFRVSSDDLVKVLAQLASAEVLTSLVITLVILPSICTFAAVLRWANYAPHNHNATTLGDLGGKEIILQVVEPTESRTRQPLRITKLYESNFPQNPLDACSTSPARPASFTSHITITPNAPVEQEFVDEEDSLFPSGSGVGTPHLALRPPLAVCIIARKIHISGDLQRLETSSAIWTSFSRSADHRSLAIFFGMIWRSVAAASLRTFMDPPTLRSVDGLSGLFVSILPVNSRLPKFPGVFKPCDLSLIRRNPHIPVVVAPMIWKPTIGPGVRTPSSTSPLAWMILPKSQLVSSRRNDLTRTITSGFVASDICALDCFHLEHISPLNRTPVLFGRSSAATSYSWLPQEFLPPFVHHRNRWAVISCIPRKSSMAVASYSPCTLLARNLGISELLPCFSWWSIEWRRLPFSQTILLRIRRETWHLRRDCFYVHAQTSVVTFHWKRRSAILVVVPECIMDVITSPLPCPLPARTVVPNFAPFLLLSSPFSRILVFDFLPPSSVSNRTPSRHKAPRHIAAMCRPLRHSESPPSHENKDDMPLEDDNAEPPMRFGDLSLDAGWELLYDLVSPPPPLEMLSDHILSNAPSRVTLDPCFWQDIPEEVFLQVASLPDCTNEEKNRILTEYRSSLQAPIGQQSEGCLGMALLDATTSQVTDFTPSPPIPLSKHPHHNHTSRFMSLFSRSSKRNASTPPS
ncbi:hypothetical protein JAAARDRAFT_189734 [Jaapia argillacea MUCL 33604]|uniref:Uncharacterized protein n=1 Tax=Jaapia argillacea MUCL 33604 TaxID=933084 RepID=A0A067QFW8_9AGAM|nr:hypothetical protein JAAARDRAFT_189734 [Jaapia argillacea MUCL 33604]